MRPVKNWRHLQKFNENVGDKVSKIFSRPLTNSDNNIYSLFQNAMRKNEVNF